MQHVLCEVVDDMRSWPVIHNTTFTEQQNLPVTQITARKSNHEHAFKCESKETIMIETRGAGVSTYKTLVLLGRNPPGEIGPYGMHFPLAASPAFDRMLST